jgi:hypothetical protein
MQNTSPISEQGAVIVETPNVETLVKLAEQLSEEEQIELMHRLEALLPPRQRPSQTLRVFHAKQFPESMTVGHEDEYGDNE